MGVSHARSRTVPFFVACLVFVAACDGMPWDSETLSSEIAPEVEPQPPEGPEAPQDPSVPIDPAGPTPPPAPPSASR